MRWTAGAGEWAVSRIWSMERPTASAAWAAETSCAPPHSIGFLMVAMMLLPLCRGLHGLADRAIGGRAVGHGEPVDLYQWKNYRPATGRRGSGNSGDSGQDGRNHPILGGLIQ